jgi:ubiquinone/menaquinone biosynthesis C-methylase UbiE
LTNKMEHSCRDRVELSVGDATVIPRSYDNVTALFSCFALQQMNQPSSVLNSWYESMAAGGILVVCYWPAIVENGGPWRRLIDLSNLKGSQVEGWEKHLLDQVVESGAEILTDTLIPHTMSWTDAEEFWQVMTESGPWHVRRLKFGDAEMESLKAAFLFGDKKEPLVHRPFARLLVLRKPLRSSL